MKLAICVPTYDRWEADMGTSLAITMANLASDGAIGAIRLVRSEGSIAADGRNDLIRDALANEATHILFVDTDMTFGADEVRSLIGRDLDFVAADYRRRIAPHSTIAVDLDGGPVPPGDGLVEIVQCGLGLALVKTAIIAKMTYPWSGFMTRTDGTLDDSVWFCRNARNAGVRLFIDQAATRGVGHVGKSVLRIE